MAEQEVCRDCGTVHCPGLKQWIEDTNDVLNAVGGLVSELYERIHGEWPDVKITDQYESWRWIFFEKPVWRLASEAPPPPPLPKWLDKKLERRIPLGKRCTHDPPDICPWCQNNFEQNEYEKKLKSQAEEESPVLLG